jgi:exonuclease III
MGTQFTAMSYNTHLFGEFTGIPGTHWQDDLRVEALAALLASANADVIGIQEMWSSRYVEAIAKQFPSAFYDLHDPGKGAPSNPSGLLLLAGKRVTLDAKHAEYYDYIHEIKHSVKHDILHPDDVFMFDPKQDMITGKGYLRVPATIDGMAITLMVTHMPTGSGTYTNGVAQCFDALAKAATKDDAPVLLLADFNVSETDKPLSAGQTPSGKSSDRYTLWIGKDGTLGQAGLSDAYRTLYPDAGANSGFSVVGTTNTCWRHFNGDKIAKNTYDQERIDHMMYRGLTPVSMSILGLAGFPPPSAGGTQQTDYSDSQNAWIWLDHGSEKRDLSDHYPVIGSFTL